MKKIIAIFLCVVMVFSIVGCSKGAKLVKETEAQITEREALEENIKNLYTSPSKNSIGLCMEQINNITAGQIEESLKDFALCFVRYISTATLFTEGEYSIMGVVTVVDFSTGEKNIFNETVIARHKDGKALLVAQENVPEDIQKKIIDKNNKNKSVSEAFLKDCIKEYSKESKAFKEWYNKRKKILKIKSTDLSIKDEVQVLEPVYSKDNRVLVWSEEFENVKSLSETKMVYDRTMNNSSLKITKDDSNLSFENGTMTMYARPVNDGKYHYSIPDGISTLGKMAYVGGYIELRAKVPFEHGAWPSFWEKSHPDMYSTDYMAEIDIFEVFSSETALESNLHKWGVDHYQGGIGDTKVFEFASTEIANDWHTYGFEWTDQYYRFYVDGVCYCTLYVDNEHDFAPQIYGMGGFQDYHYVILNNFIFNDESSYVPFEEARLSDNETKVIKYTVDYIRLYQNPEKDKLIVFD